MVDPTMSFTTAQARQKAQDEAAGGEFKWLEFEVDGDTFQAAPFAPGGALLDAAAISVAQNKLERLTLIGKFLDGVLTEESAERFAKRMRSGDEPIDLETAAQIVAKLMEHYGGHPTVPPSPSPVG